MQHGKSMRAEAYSIANGGTAYVYANDSVARERALAAIQKELGARVTILEPEAISTLGGAGDAAFAVIAEPGFGFGAKRTGAIIVDTPGHGQHGYRPTDANMHSSFIAVGGKVQPRDLGEIEMVDIAPTIARWLGVALPSATGNPIDLVQR
jgi:predicted AlkP superfamily pyrophosphatase or phosphodiesterase